MTYYQQNRKIALALREMVLDQVGRINDAAGTELLYVNECAGHLFLYGNPGGGHIDRLMACVPEDVEGLASLLYKLEKEVVTV